MNIYTDGSKDKHQAGAGVAILKDGEVPVDTDGKEKIYSYHLTEKTTVFQSEVFAQKMAATLIINGSFGPGKWVNKNKDITINTDNQASILALSKVWVKSKLVKETLDLLDRASSCCKSLKLRWVRSHSQHEGNEMADTAAREGRDDNVTPDWESPLLAKAVMHNEIDKMTLRLWKWTWNEVIGCRQTRHFFPEGPRAAFSKSILALPRPIAGQMVQVLTGHTHLKRHQAVIDDTERTRYLEALNWDNADDDGNAIIDAPDPKCSRCKIGDETPLHLLAECDNLATLRLQIFGKEELVAPGEIPDFSDIPVYQLIAFFREANFETLSMKPLTAQYLPTNTGGEESIKSLRDRKAAGDVKGQEWTSKYLFHIPLKRGYKSKLIDDDAENSAMNSTGEVNTQMN